MIRIDNKLDNILNISRKMDNYLSINIRRLVYDIKEEIKNKVMFEWKSIYDLPRNNGEVVLVTLKDLNEDKESYTDIAIYNDGEFYINNINIKELNLEVLYWGNLPSPYKF